MRQRRKRLADVERLWLEGYTLVQIAKITNLDDSTLYKYVEKKTLVLPERDWVQPYELGIPHKMASHWAAAGLIRRSPGGLYPLEATRVLKDEVYNRQCAHPGCVKPLLAFDSRRRFCGKHLRTGVNEPLLVQLLRERPGMKVSLLTSRINSPPELLEEALAYMFQQGRIRFELRTGERFRNTSSRHVWLVEHDHEIG